MSEHHEQSHEHEGHNHSHSGHSHGLHGHGADIKGARLLVVMLLNFVITAAEIVGGVIAGSLSLISDALHNLSDALSFVISYFAIKISKKQSDIKKTFGYKRVTILAALLNSAVLAGICVYLFVEAADKFINPRPIDGFVVIWVALVGLAANAVGVLLLKESSRGDMNIKSSYLHLIADTLSSVGVVIAGVLIYFFGVYWVDPLLTVLIGLYILKESFGILKEAVNILMQGTPASIDIEKIAKELGEIGGVVDIHHVHVWCIDENNINFEAHVNVDDIPVSGTKEISQKFEHILSEHYGINHVTLQFEHECCGGVGLIKPHGN